jgi:heptosyltransferase-2
MFRLRKEIGRGPFDVGLSARWDPRDHFLLTWMRAKSRLGFPRLGSGMFLTKSLRRAAPGAHRYENWRVLAQSLGLELPALQEISVPEISRPQQILIHSGAGQPVRVWPLERYRSVVGRLRNKKYSVQVACDPDQREWWLRAGEPDVATPHTVAELLALTDRAGVFIGNDSGPGHLAAFSGVPTFTIFGPQLPEWFSPMHPAARWNEGKPCPYKPCSDYCRFAAPLCLTRLAEDEIWPQVESFVSQHLSRASVKPVT